MRLRYAGLLFVVLMAGGCSNDDENKEASVDNDQPQAINYETQGEQNERLGLRNQSIGEQGGYPQTEQNDLNRGDNPTGDNTDSFTNEQSKQIANHLMNRRDIRVAQVAVTDDKVVVAVILVDHNDHEISTDIKKDVRKFEPDKTIVVYTDDNNWDRVNNLKARLKQSNLPNDVKDNIKQFFNSER